MANTFKSRAMHFVLLYLFEKQHFKRFFDTFFHKVNFSTKLRRPTGHLPKCPRNQSDPGCKLSWLIVKPCSTSDPSLFWTFRDSKPIVAFSLTVRLIQAGFVDIIRSPEFNGSPIFFKCTLIVQRVPILKKNIVAIFCKKLYVSIFFKWIINLIWRDFSF